MTANVPDATQRVPIRKRALIGGCMLGLVLAFGVEILHVVFGTNLHTVAPGMCYRSAQLSADRLQDVVHRLGIRTVINLRGPNEGESWYQDEARAVKELGIDKVDIRLSGYAPPEDADFHKLIDALKDMKYPILVHCHSGSDRSGLASALFLLLKTDAGLAEARGQVSLRFGHNPFGSATCPETVLNEYSHWLEKSGQKHSPENLQRWAHTVYRYADYQTQTSAATDPIE
jgi:protein tyrosine phosphatase (PTP) superfamily phosphohydrolase (DUF442 family)